MQPEVRSKSLILRRIELADAQLIFDHYANDIEVARYMSWRITGKFEDTLAFVKTAIGWWENPETANDFTYAVLITESNNFIGCCSIGPHSPTEKYHWGLGYNFARHAWGKGFATEAVSALTNAAISLPGVYRVSAVVDVENVASARVLEKSGLLREGLLKRFSMHPNASSEPRDIFIYARTR